MTTAEQLVTLWEDRRAIQNLMGIFSGHYLLREERTIPAELFARREDLCLTVDNGYYLGREAVTGYFEALHEKNLLTTRLIMQKYPEAFQGKTAEEAYGCGLLNYKPLDTPVMEVAGDRQTARGIWTCRNSYSDLTVGGPVAFYDWGWAAADFVRENDAWKLWHLQMLNEVHVQAGLQYDEIEKPYPPVAGFEEMADFRMPAPTVARCVRTRYAANRPGTPCPKPPKPYERFDPSDSYGYPGEV